MNAPDEAFEVHFGTADDRSFVLDLGRRTAMDSVGAMREAPQALVQANYERLLEFAENQPHVVLVAADASGRLGFLLLMLDLPDEVTGLAQAFIAYMAVEPRARRRGIGKALLEAAEREARERALPLLAFMVTEGNVAARTLYARAGYITERRLMCKAL